MAPGAARLGHRHALKSRCRVSRTRICRRASSAAPVSTPSARPGSSTPDERLRGGRYGQPLTRKSQVLDFGCGWGRYARMFLRDVPADNIWCVDSWDLALRTCEQTGVPGRKVKIEQMPPSPLPSATFDTSVRLLGVLAPVAQGSPGVARGVRACRQAGGARLHHDRRRRWFLDTCRDFREHPEKQVERVARRFSPTRSSTTTPRPRRLRPRRDRSTHRTAAGQNWMPSTTATQSFPVRTSRSTGETRSRSSSSSPIAPASSRPSAS